MESRPHNKDFLISIKSKYISTLKKIFNENEKLSVKFTCKNPERATKIQEMIDDPNINKYFGNSISVDTLPVVKNDNLNKLEFPLNPLQFVYLKYLGDEECFPKLFAKFPKSNKKIHENSMKLQIKIPYEETLNIVDYVRLQILVKYPFKIFKESEENVEMFRNSDYFEKNKSKFAILNYSGAKQNFGESAPQSLGIIPNDTLILAVNQKFLNDFVNNYEDVAIFDTELDLTNSLFTEEFQKNEFAFKQKLVYIENYVLPKVCQMFVEEKLGFSWRCKSIHKLTLIITSRKRKVFDITNKILRIINKIELLKMPKELLEMGEQDFNEIKPFLDALSKESQEISKDNIEEFPVEINFEFNRDKGRPVFYCLGVRTPLFERNMEKAKNYLNDNYMELFILDKELLNDLFFEIDDLAMKYAIKIVIDYDNSTLRATGMYPKIEKFIKFIDSKRNQPRVKYIDTSIMFNDYLHLVIFKKYYLERITTNMKEYRGRIIPSDDPCIFKFKIKNGFHTPIEEEIKKLKNEIETLVGHEIMKLESEEELSYVEEQMKMELEKQFPVEIICNQRIVREYTNDKDYDYEEEKLEVNKPNFSKTESIKLDQNYDTKEKLDVKFQTSYKKSDNISSIMMILESLELRKEFSELDNSLKNLFISAKIVKTNYLWNNVIVTPIKFTKKSGDIEFNIFNHKSEHSNEKLNNSSTKNEVWYNTMFSKIQLLFEDKNKTHGIILPNDYLFCKKLKEILVQQNDYNGNKIIFYHEKKLDHKIKEIFNDNLFFEKEIIFKYQDKSSESYFIECDSLLNKYLMKAYRYYLKNNTFKPLVALKEYNYQGYQEFEIYKIDKKIIVSSDGKEYLAQNDLNQFLAELIKSYEIVGENDIPLYITKDRYNFNIYTADFKNKVFINKESKRKMQFEESPSEISVKNPSIDFHGGNTMKINKNITNFKPICIRGLPKDINQSKMFIYNSLADTNNTEEILINFELTNEFRRFCNDIQPKYPDVLITKSNSQDKFIIKGPIVNLRKVFLQLTSMIEKQSGRKNNLMDEMNPRNLRRNESIVEFPFDEDLPLISEIKQDDLIYNEIYMKFKNSMPINHIKKIEIIANKPLYQKYHKMKTSMQMMRKSLNEKLLFHGTRNTDPKMIYNGIKGFDISMASSEGAYGKAIYFAEDASFADEYAYKDYSCYKQIILAQVLLGEFTEVSQKNQHIDNPPYNRESHNYYDSSKAIIYGKDACMIYENDRAYPLYLITYF